MYATVAAAMLATLDTFLAVPELVKGSWVSLDSEYHKTKKLITHIKGLLLVIGLLKNLYKSIDMDDMGHLKALKPNLSLSACLCQDFHSDHSRRNYSLSYSM